MRALSMIVSAVLAWSAMVAFGQGRQGSTMAGPRGNAANPSIVRPSFAGDTTVFVPNDLPMFIDGRRVDAVGGGHVVTVSHVDGILVDGVLFMTMPKRPPPHEPALLEDGFSYYVVARAADIAIDAIKQGASAEKARQIMLDFWAQYADSVEVTADDWSAVVTYKEQSTIVPFPHPVPENLPPPPTPLQSLLNSAEHLVLLLNAGGLVIQSGSDGLNLVEIRRTDAGRALEDLALVASRAEVWGHVGSEVVYRGMTIVDGKYRLGPSMVADFVRRERGSDEPRRGTK